MPRSAARLILGLFALGAACKSPSSARAPSVKNACEPGRGSPCADGKGVCWSDDAVGAKVCFARHVDVNEIAVEVHPAALSPLASTTPRYARFDITDPDTPFVDLGSIGALIPDVNVIVRRPGAEPWRSSTNCTRPRATNGEVGTRATFRPRARAAGIEAPAVYAEAVPSRRYPGGQPDRWDLATPLPPSELYDVYLEPLDDTCPTPPLLVHGYNHCVDDQGQPPGDQDCTVDVSYVDRRLEGSFALPRDPENGTMSLEGWSVEIVDGESGLRLSVPGVVGPTDDCEESRCLAPFGIRDPGGALHPLDYTDVVVRSGLPPSQTYVRLRPPAGRPGPTFVFFYARIGEETEIERTFELSRLPNPDAYVQIEGTLERAGADGARTGAPGAVWFRSLALDQQPSGVPTLAQGAVPTEPDGSFLLTLPSGSYDIVGAANDRSLGLARTNWSIPDRPLTQGGRVLSASDSIRRSVRVLDPSRNALGGAPLRISPVLSTPPELDKVLGTNPLNPRAISTVTADANAEVGGIADEGTAELLVDTDRDHAYVLTVPFERKTGLPWTVLPSWPDPARGSDVIASLPWEVTGKIVNADALSNPSQPAGADLPGLPGGQVRIYGRQCDRTAGAPPCSSTFVLLGSGTINDNPRPTPGVRAEEPGRFTILLPSSLLCRQAITFRCVRTQRQRSLSIVGVRRPLLSRRPRRRDGPRRPRA